MQLAEESKVERAQLLASLLDFLGQQADENSPQEGRFPPAAKHVT